MDKLKKTIYYTDDRERHAVRAFQKAYRGAAQKGALDEFAGKSIGTILKIAEHEKAAGDLAEGLA